MGFDSRRILWVKSVTRDDEIFAYGGEDPTSRAKEPEGPGDVFALHVKDEDAETLAMPAIGDLIALTQHDQVTHLVEVVGAGVERRPRSTMRPGTRDAKFSFQRDCRVALMSGFDDAPMIEDAFGFDPDAKGGDVLEIAALPATIESGLPLWAIQRRIERSLRGLIAPRRASLKASRPGIRSRRRSS